MRVAKLVTAFASVALVMAVAGCGRFTVAPNETPTAPSAPVASSPPSPDAGSTAAPSLDQISSDLNDVDGALAQSDEDVSQGDQAAQKDDSH
jgi:hypothetical protein